MQMSRIFRGLTGCALLAAGLACASNPKTPTAPPATPDASQATEHPAGTQPPGGAWLTDEQGRRYFLETVSKAGPFQRTEGSNKVRTRWGIDITVDHEDDQFFYYRVYESDYVPPPKPQAPTAADVTRVQASYTPRVQASSSLRFEAVASGLPNSGQWRNGFVLADINEDGHLDIVHGPARKSLSPPVVFLGDGAGKFKRWQGAKYPALGYDYGDIAVGDLNADGHLDMVLGIHLRGIVALVGDGAGNFADWGRGLDYQRPGEPYVAGFSSRAVTLVDWNGDSRLDILAMGEGPRLSGGGTAPSDGAAGPVLYLNQGDGSWQRHDQGTSNNQNFGDGIAAGDFDGDGRPDFVTASSSMGSKTILYRNGGDGRWLPTEIQEIRPLAVVRAVDVADFDGDGRDDVAVGYLAKELGTWRSGLDLLLSKAGGQWERLPLAFEEGRDGVTGIGSGDLDGDGSRDLVATTGAGKIMVFRGGKQGFSREAGTGLTPEGGACRGYGVGLGDLDGDGRAEVVLSFAGEPSALFAPLLCVSEGGFQVWRAADAKKPASAP